MGNTPIFIHSLFRAGSTYLFYVFRRSSEGYYCYQEPLHEILLNINNDDAGIILDIWGNTMAELRHPTLDKPYFWEFWQIRDSLRGLFKKSFCYDNFFVLEVPPGLPDDQRQYFSALIRNAKGRPVLQECRSSGRVAALKDAFRGVHIHLWREPRNQWWSYKVNDYFDATIHRIFNALTLPPILKAVKQECRISDFRHEDLAIEFEHAIKGPLAARENYLAFFALWLYSYLECEKHGDVTVSIDMLRHDPDYRDDITKELAAFGIKGLDFSDCAIPWMNFTDNEIPFFRDVEQYTFELFLRFGYGEADLKKVQDMLDHIRSIKPAPDDVVNDLVRSHQIVLRYINRLAETSLELVSQQTYLSQLQTDLEAKKAEAAQETDRLLELEALRNDLEVARAKIDDLESEVKQWRALAESMRARRLRLRLRELIAVWNPIRHVKQLWDTGRRVIPCLPRRAIKECLKVGVELILANTRIRSLLKMALVRHPRLYAGAMHLLARLRVGGHEPASAPFPVGVPGDEPDGLLARMSPGARELFMELKRAVGARR